MKNGFQYLVADEQGIDIVVLGRAKRPKAVQRVATVIQLVVVYHRDERMPLELIRLHQQELWCPDVSGVAVDVVYL